jgi:hypothetical protein
MTKFIDLPLKCSKCGKKIIARIFEEEEKKLRKKAETTGILLFCETCKTRAKHVPNYNQTFVFR